MMTAQDTIGRTFAGSALAVLASGALLVGCGGVGGTASSSTAKATSTARTVSQESESPQQAAISRHAKLACEGAVQDVPSLTPSAKAEIAALCYRINYVREDNEKTVRSVCQEVANASSLSSEAARKRLATSCYTKGMG